MSLPLNPRTERYLKRNGVEPDIIAALRHGDVLAIDAEALTSWIKAAFLDGRQHSRASLAVALAPEIDRLVEAARQVGKQDGYAEAQAEVVEAETIADRLRDQVHDLRKLVMRLQVFADQVAPFQAIVADCLLWFDGFSAHFAGKASHKRPKVPERERLRQLNEALQGLLPVGLNPDLDDIPF